MESDESAETELSVEEAAVVGVMRRGEMEQRAIFNYAMTFSEPTSDP